MYHVEIELDQYFREAYARKASDIHLTMIEDGLVVRFRIDGCLVFIGKIPATEGELLINRLKILSGLDISEKRLPQDGRYVWNNGTHSGTIRISTLPSVFGESIVCRLFWHDERVSTLDELGLPKMIQQEIEDLLQRPHGLLLVCGPTGSGKSSTLYAMIQALRGDEEQIITLENPVERVIDRAVQVNVNEKIGMTFSRGLRSILRHDPDTIVVGEIRDNETAALAVQAALTGHRVLSTIHTNTAIGVVERLIDMGIEPYLLKATLIGALSQRLLRHWDGTKYSGRFGIYELLSIPKENCNWDVLQEYVLITLREAAEEAVKTGKTSLEEVKRVGIIL